MFPILSLETRWTEAGIIFFLELVSLLEKDRESIGQWFFENILWLLYCFLDIPWEQNRSEYE